ncbi:hypothetical protein KSP39_PZI017640 [Platanthera zijinensis]|uniref:Uncharacterized protein n=1 Tax=Platanthera zijinensis TaxID=2320716 RepID=A0AAP0B5W2_9ASPA
MCAVCSDGLARLRFLGPNLPGLTLKFLGRTPSNAPKFSRAASREAWGAEIFLGVYSILERNYERVFEFRRVSLIWLNICDDPKDISCPLYGISDWIMLDSTYVFRENEI